MMKTLFLQAPSFEGFDGGAGARYQMRREVKSFWYPTWLAQPAALVEGSKLIDAPPHRLRFADIAPEANERDLIVLHTSTPSFSSDIKTVRALKDLNPKLKIGMVGAKVAVDPTGSLQACEQLDFVGRNEFDFTVKEVAEGRDFAGIKGLSYRDAAGRIVHNEERPILHNMDELPFVTPVYKRDLTIENYFGGYLLHPYISFYTGRGCKSRCTFCLWPQTVGGHAYRVRSVGHVIDELKWAKQAFPQVKEFFFDDDTLTDNLPRVEELAREIGKLGITWSCNAKGNVPRSTLKILKDNGLRLLLVGYESGNQQILHNIKKGMRVDHQGLPRARHRHSRHLHPRPAGRDQGNHRGNHSFRHRNQPAHHPGVARGAVSGDLPAQAGDGQRLVCHRQRRAGRRVGGPDRATQLPASQPHRNLRLG